jgi:hypothetical protein
MMKGIVCLFILICVPVALAQVVTLEHSTESTHAVRAFAPSGETWMQVVRVQLRIHHVNGKDERGNLVTVYDPQTGHYLWRYSEANHLGDTGSFWDELDQGREAVYAGDNALVDFYMPGALFAKTYFAQAPNLAAAERASMHEMELGLPASEKNGYHNDWKEIPVARAMAIEWACPPYGDPAFSQRCQFGAKSITSVSKTGVNWRLVVRNRWDQEVILDSQFNLVSTQRLPESPIK